VTTYELTVRTGHGNRLEFEFKAQSYRKCVSALHAFIVTAQNQGHTFSIVQTKTRNGARLPREVAHGSFYGGKRI